MEFFRINRPTIVPHLEAKRVLQPISGIETASFAFLRPTGLSKRELLYMSQLFLVIGQGNQAWNPFQAHACGRNSG